MVPHRALWTLRIDFGGALCHATSRGSARESNLLDDNDEGKPGEQHRLMAVRNCGMFAIGERMGYGATHPLSLDTQWEVGSP